MELLKDDSQTRLKRRNLQVNEEEKETINNLTESYVRVVLRNIDKSFLSGIYLFIQFIILSR